MDLFINILAGVLIAATPLVFASLGELVAERAGVLNLGVEGMMVMGAVAAFLAGVGTGSPLLGLLAAIVAGTAMALLFGLLTQVFFANQVASGLALTLFGLGLSALLGQGYTGQSAPRFPTFTLFGAKMDFLVIASVLLAAGLSWFLTKTRPGLILRAIGDNHDAAHAIGYPVVTVRLLALAFGGAMAGVGGAYLCLAQTPFWVERMTAGRGWIALALVVFAAWKPWRALLGAYLFGGITILQLHAQGLGVKVDAQILSMLPYIATIIVVVLISRDGLRLKLAAPQCLGKPFQG